MVGLLNLLGAGSVLRLEQSRFGAIDCSAGLFVLGAEFLIFESHQTLSPFSTPIQSTRPVTFEFTLIL
jgi:hypothetical protein